jgi:hypothetical protein
MAGSGDEEPEDKAGRAWAVDIKPHKGSAPTSSATPEQETSDYQYFRTLWFLRLMPLPEMKVVKV